MKHTTSEHTLCKYNCHIKYYSKHIAVILYTWTGSPLRTAQSAHRVVQSKQPYWVGTGRTGSVVNWIRNIYEPFSLIQHFQFQHFLILPVIIRNDRSGWHIYQHSKHLKKLLKCIEIMSLIIWIFKKRKLLVDIVVDIHTPDFKHEN